MPASFVQLPADSTGKKLRTRQRTVGADTVQEQYILLTTEEVVTFYGRANTFRIPGRAGTTGQRIAALHNATGSAVIVKINRVTLDMVQTVVKVVTVLPPVVRIHRFTVVPTNGSTMAKVTMDTALSSNASVTCWQDASADGTVSASALTITIPASNILAEEFAPRLITAAGYEMMDRAMFFEGDTDITLRALEGIAVELVYVLATQNPATDMWIVGLDWIEYTVP